MKTNKIKLKLNNSKTAWPTKILMSFLSVSGNSLQDDYVIFQKSVDNLEIMYKTPSILVWDAVLP